MYIQYVYIYVQYMYVFVYVCIAQTLSVGGGEFSFIENRWRILVSLQFKFQFYFWIVHRLNFKSEITGQKSWVELMWPCSVSFQLFQKSWTRTLTKFELYLPLLQLQHQLFRSTDKFLWEEKNLHARIFVVFLNAPSFMFPRAAKCYQVTAKLQPSQHWMEVW
jgi:hypothetical protein